MHKCGANPLYLASIAIGSFLMGGAVGLWLSKDEEDIFEENCVKIEDFENLNHYNAQETDVVKVSDIVDYYKDKYGYDAEEMAYLTKKFEDMQYDAGPRESYSRMTKELYPDNYMDNKNLDYSEIVEDGEEDTDDEEFDVLYDEEGEEAVVDDGDISVEAVKNDPNVDPRVISLDEYQMGTEYVGETLIYYEEDDTLATERDEVIYNVKDIVGSDALSRFGDMSGDKDTVIVRNEKRKIDYEIRKEEGSYKELVLGIELDDETALKNAQKAFKKKMADEDIER